MARSERKRQPRQHSFYYNPRHCPYSRQGLPLADCVPLYIAVHFSACVDRIRACQAPGVLLSKVGRHFVGVHVCGGLWVAFCSSDPPTFLLGLESSDLG